MKNSYNTIVIGVDHGYQNIKTAHAIFKSGVTAYDKEPIFTSNLLVYQGRYCTFVNDVRLRVSLKEKRVSF